MEIFSEFGKYGPTGVAVASLLFSYLVIRGFFTRLDAVDKRHEEAFSKLSKAIDKNTAVTDETYQFLRNLNGSLKKIVKDKKAK